MRWFFIGVVWHFVVIVQSVLSFCSWFCCDGGFVFPLSGCYSSIELVLRSVIFVICGLLRMRIVFSSCSFRPCRLFGIIVHLLFSHWMHMIWNLVRISVDVCSGHLLQNEICLLQSSLSSVDMDGFLINVSHWIGDFFWTNQTAVYWDWVCLFVEIVMWRGSEDLHSYSWIDLKSG